jgi:hypothetical protein
MTHFNDDDIPRVWHRLKDVHRTTELQDLLETPQWRAFAKTHDTSTSCTVIRHAFLSLIKCFSKGAKTTTEVSLTAVLVDMSRWGGYEYSHVTVHYKTLYKYSLLLQFVLFHRKDVLRGWLRRYCKSSKGTYAYCTTSTSHYVHVCTFNFSS